MNKQFDPSFSYIDDLNNHIQSIQVLIEVFPIKVNVKLLKESIKSQDLIGCLVNTFLVD